jgi:hypothetical protein
MIGCFVNNCFGFRRPGRRKFKNRLTFIILHINFYAVQGNFIAIVFICYEYLAEGDFSDFGFCGIFA